MHFSTLLALCTGVLLAFSMPTEATIVVFGHHEGLDGQSTVQPGAEVPIFSVRLVNDGTSALQSIELTLSDLSTPTGIASSAFGQLRLYRSEDATFSAGSDSLVGTQASVALNQVSAIPLSEPLTWSSSFPYFIATLTLSTTHSDELGTNKDAFRVGCTSGSISTSNGRIGPEIIADNANSVTIDIVATQIAFATHPADASASNGDITSGRPFATQPVLEARDAYGNVDVDASGSATLSIGSGSPILSGTATTAWVEGRASFTNLSATTTVDGASFTIAANGTGLTGAQSNALIADIVATEMVFSTQPAHSGVAHGDVLSGVPFQVQPVIQARDADGRIDTDFVDAIILSTNGPGPLSGTTTRQAVGGIATFTDIAYTATEDGQIFTLTADDQPGGSGGNIPSVSTSDLQADIIATQIVFTTLPADPTTPNGDVVSDKVFTTQPVLEARSSSGQRDINFTGSVTLSLPPGNPTLSGTLSKTWVGGRADFVGNGLRVIATNDATPFALSATSGAISGQSTTLTADVVATQMVTITAPADTRAIHGDIVSGIAFQVQPILEAQDDNGVADVHYADGTPSLTLNSGTVVLSGTTTVGWIDGRATWNDVAVSTSSEGARFALSFSNGGALPNVVSDELTVDIVATEMVFTSLPADAAATNGDIVSGSLFATQPIVQAQDADGRVDTHFSDTVTLTTSAPGTLSGTTTQTAAAGVVTFTDITYTATQDGETFTLTADDQTGGSGGDLPDATTAEHTADIVATQIAFAVLPADPAAPNGDVISGKPFASQPTLQATDANGQIDRDVTGTAVLSVTPNSLSLIGANSMPWNNGQAIFDESGLGVASPNDGAIFSLSATTAGLDTAQTGNLTADIVATQLVFTSLPTDPSAANGDVVSGNTFATQPVIQAQDAAGRVDAHFTDTVTLATSAPGTLYGTTTRAAAAGVVTFTDVTYTATQDGETFTLTADDQTGGSGGDLPDVTTADYTADVVATQIVFTALPADPDATNGDIVSGKPFASQPTLQATDDNGQIDIHFADTVTLTTSAAGALSGTTARQAAEGIVTFTDVTYTATQDGETFALVAADQTGGAGGDLPDISTPNYTADIVATQMVFTNLPADPEAINGDVVSGNAFASQPILRAQDADGRVDLDFVDTVTLTTSAPGTLSGTTTLQAVEGVVTFTDVAYTATQDGETFALSAADQTGGSGDNLPDAASTDHTADIIATRLVFAVEPAHQGVAFGDVLSGVPFQTQPVIQALDPLGGIDAHFTDIVSLTTSAPGALSGTTAIQATEGIAAFTDIAYTATEDHQSFTLDADDESDGSGGDLANTSSGPHTADIVATRLVFVEQPRPIALVGENLLENQLSVMAVHQDGALDSEFNGLITLEAIPAGSAVPLLALTALPGRTLSASGGQVHFTSAIYSQAGHINLRATSPGLTPAHSDDVLLTGWLSLREPGQQIANQLAFQRDSTPKNIALYAFSTVAQNEPIHLQDLRVDLETGGGMSTVHIDTVYLWRDSGTLGAVDSADQLLGAATVDGDGHATFGALRDTLVDQTNFLVTWSARSALQADWTLRARTYGDAITAKSTRASGITVPVLGERIEGELHQVGQVGQPHHILLSATPDTVVADSLSSTILQATIVDAQRRPITTDDRTLVSFTTLRGAAWIAGSLSAQVQQGVASTELRAGTTPGTVNVYATAVGLLADTIEVTLIAGPVASIELVADPPSILLDDGDRTTLTARLRDAHGNLTGQGEEISFLVSGSGNFANGFSSLSTSDTEDGLEIVAFEPDTLRVKATIDALSQSLDIPVIATQPPYLSLTTSRSQIPASGEQSAEITAYLLDSRDQLLGEDSTTRVRFTVVGGQALLSQEEVIARDGIARTQVRSLGLAGTIVVRAEAEQLQADEIQLMSQAAAPYQIDLVVVPSTIVADQQSTTTLSAIVRDSLGNVVTDADATVSFSIESGDAELIGPQTARADVGTAQTTLRSSIHAGTVRLRAEAPNLRAGTTQVQLVAGPAAKVQLRAEPTALPASDTASAELIAEIQDVHGNRIFADSTTIVSFSISGGPGTIVEPRFANVDQGRAIGRVRATGAQGKILVFAGSSSLVPSTVEIPVRQSQPPRFTESTIELEILEDGPSVYLDLSPLVEDADSPLSELEFTLTDDALPVAIQIADQQVIATPTTPNFFGTVQTTLTVRDQTGLEDQSDVLIHVLPQNDPPLITSIPDTIAAVDSLYFYTIRGIDPDGDPMRFSLLAGPDDMRFDSAIGKAAWRPNTPGTYDVRIAISDGQAASEQAFRLHVIANLQRMAFTSEPATRAYIGQPYSYQAQLINAQLALEFSLITGPDRMTVDPTSGRISWLPKGGDPTSSIVTLLAASGDQQIRQSFQLDLVAGNEAPQIVSTPILSARVDSLYLYAVQASDPDGDPLVYTIARGPDNMRINPLNGLISWVPQRSDVGEHDIAVKTYDGQFNDEQVFQLVVHVSNAPPTLASIRGIVVDETTALLNLEGIVTDNDHDFADLSWTIQRIDGDLLDINYATGDRSILFRVDAEFTRAQIYLSVLDPDGNTDELTLRVERRQTSDFNGDTSIDLNDFFALADAFGSSPDAENWNVHADINEDGEIDFDDFFAFVDTYTRANAPIRQKATTLSSDRPLTKNNRQNSY